jgi:hypothetical protein
VGVDATESFLIHHSDADGQPLAADPDRPVRVPDDDDLERDINPYHARGAHDATAIVRGTESAIVGCADHPDVVR